LIQKKKKLKIIDLFAGVGGLSHGFYKKDLFEIVAANEILPDMATAYSLNHPDIKMYNCDIKELSPSQLYHDINLQEGDIDVVVGGPPCQAYSTVGKRLMDDPRGKLFQEFYRLIQNLKPKIFLYENVSGLLSMKHGLHEHIVSLFRSLSYRMATPVLNAMDYGIPQSRKRVIITGTLLERNFEYPSPTHGDDTLLSYLTVGDAIGDLPFIPINSESFEYMTPPQNTFQKKMRKKAPTNLQDHNSPNNNPHLVALMKALPDGGTPRDIPERHRPKSGYGNTYCRLWWNRPSTTLTRNFGTPSSSRCIHPKAARALTTREGARIQSFPDSFQFYGSRSARNLQIGNAVPPLLSEALAGSILNHFMAV